MRWVEELGSKSWRLYSPGFLLDVEHPIASRKRSQEALSINGHQLQIGSAFRVSPKTTFIS